MGIASKGPRIVLRELRRGFMVSGQEVGPGRGDLSAGRPHPWARGEVTSVEMVLAYDRHLIQTDPLLDIPQIDRELVFRELLGVVTGFDPNRKRKGCLTIPRESLSRMDSLFDACKALPSNPSVSGMRAESGLSPDSSSIGSRVRSSKVKDAVALTESMNSSDSSLDLTAEVEDPKAIVARNVSPVAEGNLYPPIGPPSVIGVEEVADWRVKYKLPADAIIRVPGPDDRVSDFCVDEVPVCEGYFESGFRDRVPSLVAKISETLEISPAAQNGGTIFVLGARSLLLGRFRRKRGNVFQPLMETGLRNLPRVDYSSGKETIEQVLRLPIERRQFPLLVSKAALMRCSIWGEMSGSKGDEALAGYKALEVMSAKKSAPKRAAPVEDDEVQFLRSCKRLTVTTTAHSSSKKKSKASGSSPSASYDWATVLTNLNMKVFPLTPVLLASKEDSSLAVQSLQVASQLFHLGERMIGVASTKAEMDALASQLFEENDVILAKDKEIRALRLKVMNQEEAGELAEMENVSLRGQLKNREEELNDLKDTAETIEAEKAMAVNGDKFVARWKLMREWLNCQTGNWDPVNVLEHYKTVKITVAKLLGHPTTSFEGEPHVPGDVEAEKAPEPAADDPPTN
ncbi:hypothetical protein F2Q68_00034468 [Brassica cretica]|uniref:Uncharacterized protein n=1 Tax=Brassica cretica TaxID=69181 RepID=A0A8S9H5U4_BRACR|nr:hypothetical protein F2Q68_00034468 [Brassica cretica]